MILSHDDKIGIYIGLKNMNGPLLLLWRGKAIVSGKIIDQGIGKEGNKNKGCIMFDFQSNFETTSGENCRKLT